MCPSDMEVEVEVEPAEKKPADLALIVALANQMKTIEDEMSVLEAELARKQEAHKQISERDLVTAIIESGLSAVPLADGTMIEVVTEHTGSISEENKPIAHGWLREHDLGDYIKNLVALQFGKGEEKMALDCVKMLLEKYPEHKIVNKEGVHHSTLKAFINRTMTAQNVLGIPEAAFGVYTKRYAAVTSTTTKQIKKRSAKAADPDDDF